jgi:hypothetical protein
MGRQLLNFELAVLIEAGAGVSYDIASSLPVISEYHSPPHIKCRQWFNTDFVIELSKWGDDAETKISGAPIRPWSMAGHFYVHLTTAGVPITLELLEGESLPKSSFRDEICRVDAALELLSRLPRPVLAGKEPYFRVARLEKCVPFVVSTTTSITDLLSTPSINVGTVPDRISYRVAGDQLLVDGVLFD